MVMFDVPPPVALRGIDAYRASWPDFCNWQRNANGSFDIHSFDIAAGTEVAFATAILLCASEESRKQDSTPTLRVSVGLRKENSRWLISHEHHSFPLES
jgi:ketosteroid isomerase-like protein